METKQKEPIVSQFTYRFGITAVDKTIDEKYPRNVLWTFENNEERLRWIGLIYNNGDYENVQLVEFDRVLTIDSV